MVTTRLNSGLLYEKQKLVMDKTINSVYDTLANDGKISAFDFDKPFQDRIIDYPDESDVFKWLEGACNSLKRKKNKKLEEKVDNLVNLICKNQHNDGYFNLYFMRVQPENKFKIRHAHELYCAGHFFESAVAHYEMSKCEKLINCAEKYALYLYNRFVVVGNKCYTTPFHPEIELALMRLYKYKNRIEILELAKFYLVKRGIANEKSQELFFIDPLPEGYINAQQIHSHLPVTEQKEAVGHVVQAMYLYCAMADYYLETKDEKYKNAVMELFDNIYYKKMYITGGVGSTYFGEAFTKEYDLPNFMAYSETCASISYAMFLNRMLKIKKDSKYADAMERVIYNSVLSGISQNGTEFFYINPLAINLRKYNRYRAYQEKPIEEKLPAKRRWKTHTCYCCPPNICRFLTSIDEYVYMKDENDIYINLFCDSVYTNGDIKVTQNTNYPADGNIEIECENLERIFIRIPFWCDNPHFSCEYNIVNGYAEINNPKKIHLEFPMKPTLYFANSKVTDTYGKASLMMGPIVYCIEGVDNGDIYSLSINHNMNETVVFDEKLHMNTIIVDGKQRECNNDVLYSKASFNTQDIRVKFIPYSTFANRIECDMLVWVNYN